MFKYATPPSPSGDTAAESPPPQNPWPKNAAALNEFEQRLTATTPAPPPPQEALSTALTVQEAIDTEFSTRSHSYCDGAMSAAMSTGTGTGGAVPPRPREDSTIQQQQHRQQVLQEETDPLRAALEDDTPGVAFYRDRNTDRGGALPAAFSGDFSSGRGGAVPVAGSLLAVSNGCAAPVGASAVDEGDGDDADLEALLRRLDGRSAAIGATSAASPNPPALLLPDDDDDTIALQSTTAASTCGGGAVDPTGDAASTAVSPSATLAVSGIATDGIDATAGSHDPFAYETPPFAGPLSSYAASVEMSAAANADSEVTVNATPPPPPAARLTDADILTTGTAGAAFDGRPNDRRGSTHHHQQRPTTPQDGGDGDDGDDIDAVLRRLDAAARRIDETLHTDAVGRIDRSGAEFDEDWRAAQIEAGATARYDAHHERSRLSLSTRSPSSDDSSSHDELHRHDAVDATSASAAPIAPPIPPNTAVEEEPTDSAPAAALEPEMSKPCRSAAVDVSLPAAVDTTAAPAADDSKELERSSSPPQEALPHPSQPPSCAASDDSGPLFFPPRREAPTVPPRRAETQVGDQHCHTDPPPPRLTKTKSPPQWSTELPTTARDVSVSPQGPTGQPESKHPELRGGRDGDAVEVTEVGMAAWRYSTGRARTPQHILDGIANPPRSSSAAPTRSEPRHQPLPPTPGVSAFESDHQRGSNAMPTSAPHAPYGTPPPATKTEESSGASLGTASPVLRERLVHEDRTRKNLRRVLAATSLRAGVSPRLPHDAIPHSSASAAIGTETRTRSPPRAYASSPSTGENGVSENHPHRSPPSARPPSSLGYTPAALRDSVASTDPRLRGDHDVRDVASTGAASRYVAPSYDDSPSRPDVRSVVDGGSSERRPVRVASPLRSEFAATTVLRGNEHVPFAFARAAVEAAEFEVRLAVEGEAGAAASHLIGEERMHRAAVGLESRQRSLDAAMAAVQGRAVAQDREALLASASATVSAAAARRSASATGHAATAAGYHPSRPQQPYRDLGEGLAALGDRVLATPPVTPRTPPRYAVRLPPSSVTDQGPTMSRAGGNEKAAALADGLAPIPASFSRSVSQRNSVVPSAAVGGVGSSARHQGVVDEPFALPHASVSPHRTPPRSTPPSHPVRRGSGIRASDELLSSLSRDASPEAKATHHFGLQYAALRSRTSPPSMGGAASSVSPDRPVRTMAEAAQEFVAAAHMMAPAVSRSVSRSASRQSPEWAGAGDHAGAPAFALPTVFLTEALGHPSNPVDVDAQGRDHAGAPGGAPVTATDRTWRGDDGATADAPSRRSGHSPHRTMDTAASSCSSLGRGRLDTSRLDSYRDPTPPPRAVSAHRRAVSHSPGPRPSMPAVRGPSGGAQPTRNTRQRTPPPVATVPGSKLDEAEQWRAARNPSAAPTGHSAAAASAPPLQRETQPPVRPVSVPAPQRSLPQQGTTQQSHGTHRQLQQPQQQQQQQGSVMSTASATERGRSRSGRPLPGERSSDVSRTPTGAWSPADPPLSFSGAEHSSRLHTTMTDSAPSQGPQSAQHPPHEKPPVHPTQTQQRTQQPQQQQIMSQQMESQVTRQPTEAPRSSSRFRSPSASSRASALRSPMSNDQPTSSGSVQQPQGSFVAVPASTPQHQVAAQARPPPQQMVQPRVVMPQQQQPTQHAAVQQPMVVQHQAQPMRQQVPIRVVHHHQPPQPVAYQQLHQSPPQQQYEAQGHAGQGDLTANGSYSFPPDVLSGSGVFLQQSLGPQFSSAAFSQFSGTDLDLDPFGRSVTAAHRTLSSRSLMKDGQDTVPSSRRVTVHTPSHLPPHPTGAPMGYHPPGTAATTTSPPRHAPRRALPPSMYPPPAAAATPTRIVRVVSPGQQRQRAPIVVRPAQAAAAAPPAAGPGPAAAPAAVPLGLSPSGAVMYSAPPRRQSLSSGGPPPPQQSLPQSVSPPRSVTQAVSNPPPEKQPEKKSSTVRGHSQPRVVSPPQQPARATSGDRAAAPPAVPSQRAPPKVWPPGSTADFPTAASLLPLRPSTTTTAGERSERSAVVGRPPAAPRISASPRAASRSPAVPGSRMLRHGPAVPEPTNRKLYSAVGHDSAGSEPLLPPRPVAAEAS